nr:phospholipase-like, aminotransferase-like mobile domain protein [Tanacetum cinerariifolium]
MPTKSELTLEQSQQGVSNDVLSGYQTSTREASLKDRVKAMKGLCTSLMILPKEIKSLKPRVYKLETIINSDKDGEFFSFNVSPHQSANKDHVNELVDALDDLVDEDLTQPFNCIDKVYCDFVLEQFLIKSSWRHCKFPWCNDISIDGRLWDALLGINDKRLGWLVDDNGVVEVEKDLSEDDGLKVQKLKAENKRLAKQWRIRFYKMKEPENDMKSSYFSNSSHMKHALEKCETNKRKFSNVFRPPVEEDTYVKVLSIDTLK